MANKKFETLDGFNSSGDVTISGNVDINTDTLYVDSLNGRVGIGKTNPSQLLDVDGTATATLFSGSFSGDGSSLTNVNAETVDGIEGTSLLRSDTSDIFNGGSLTIDSSIVSINASSSSLRLFNDVPLRFGTTSTPSVSLEFTGTGGSSGTFDLTTAGTIDINIQNDVNISGRAIANTFNPGLETVSPSSTVNLDFTQNANYQITLDQSVTFTFTLDSDASGQAGMIIINQDAVGGRTFVLPAEAKTPVGGASIVQQTDGSTTSIINYFIVSPSIVLVNYIGNFQ